MANKLSTRGIKNEMKFTCTDCGETHKGEDVRLGRMDFYIVKANYEDPINSDFRCECCQEDYEEKHCSCD